MRTRTRLTSVLAGVVVAAVALSGCLYAMIPEQAAAPTASATADTDGVDADLLPFYSQQLSWEACAGAGFDCTTVTAPLDWADPGAGDIELSVIRHAAPRGSTLGSLLTNPGGPGSSGVELVRDSLDFAVGSDLVAAYDVIGFDPRGVGESTAVTCLDDAGLDAYLYDITPGARGSDHWTAERTAANRAFADACDANSDGILPFITTENSARDMDLIRAVLGDSRLNYLGYSYGTFLGATYAGLYPERVGRMVLDGAIDPSIPGLDVNTVQAIGFESALRAYMASCLAGDDCPFRGTVDQAMDDVGSLLASVDRSPQEAADGRRLGADSLSLAIVTALYSTSSWPVLTQALTDVLQGDPTVAFILADLYNKREDGVYLDNETEAFRAYNCMDYPRDATTADEAAADARITAEAPITAPFREGPDPCEVWPYPATGTRGPITADGAAPIIVIGTTNDPATPYEWSVSLAAQLSSGVLITRVGEGHTGYNKGNACVDDAVVSYFLDGTAPTADLRCE